VLVTRREARLRAGAAEVGAAEVGATEVSVAADDSVLLFFSLIASTRSPLRSLDAPVMPRSAAIA
jgi:hypothetical protein